MSCYSASAGQLLLYADRLELCWTQMPPAMKLAHKDRESSSLVEPVYSSEDVFFEFYSSTPPGPRRTDESCFFDLPASFTVNNFDTENRRWETDILSIKNSEGKIYVLCFVQSDAELAQARTVVQHWREGCEGCRFHAVFTVYMLPPCSFVDKDSSFSQCRMRYQNFKSIRLHCFVDLFNFWS